MEPDDSVDFDQMPDNVWPKQQLPKSPKKLGINFA